MKIYSLHTEQLVNQPVKSVFEFFSRPGNLSKITPVSLGFKILTPSPIEMNKGTLINYTIRLLFMRIRWTTLITSYDPPHKFIDEQLKGPYSFWHHMHTFKETENGTLIIDDVRYVLPFSFLGRIAHFLFVRKQLKKIFSYRSSVISEIFKSDNQNKSESASYEIKIGSLEV